MLPNYSKYVLLHFTYIERQVNSQIQIIFPASFSLTACVRRLAGPLYMDTQCIYNLYMRYIHCIYFSYIDSFLIGVNPSNAAVEKY